MNRERNAKPLLGQDKEGPAIAMSLALTLLLEEVMTASQLLKLLKMKGKRPTAIIFTKSATTFRHSFDGPSSLDSDSSYLTIKDAPRFMTDEPALMTYAMNKSFLEFLQEHEGKELKLQVKGHKVNDIKVGKLYCGRAFFDWTFNDKELALHLKQIKERCKIVTSFTINRIRLAKILLALQPVTTDEYPWPIDFIHVDYFKRTKNPAQRNGLNFTATDGRALMQYRVAKPKILKHLKGEDSRLLPAWWAPKVGAMDGTTAKVDFFAEKGCRIRSGKMELLSRLLPRSFPNFAKLYKRYEKEEPFLTFTMGAWDHVAVRKLQAQLKKLPPVTEEKEHLRFVAKPKFELYAMRSANGHLLELPVEISDAKIRRPPLTFGVTWKYLKPLVKDRETKWRVFCTLTQDTKNVKGKPVTRKRVPHASISETRYREAGTLPFWIQSGDVQILLMPIHAK
jgi:hypothetical protein